MLTHEERLLLPNDDYVAFNRRHGWYRSKRVLTEGLLNHALTRIQRHFSGERDWILSPTGGFSDWKPVDGITIRNAEVLAIQNAEVRTLTLSSILGAIAARLKGCDAPPIGVSEATSTIAQLISQTIDSRSRSAA